MGALSYFLEREGLATVGISLVRENTASMQPPRALWVPFPLGRPLGKPDDPDFQTDVIRSALALLEAEAGPVLADYPHDAPAVDPEQAAACPVSFAKDTSAEDDWSARLTRELAQLKPWYELSCRRRGGRTLVGIADQPPEVSITMLAELIDSPELPRDTVWLKRAVEDLKAFYLEAMTAQPGDYDSEAMQAQFWRETTLAAAILTLYERFQSSDKPGLQLIARILAPREAVGAATGPQGDNHA